MLATLIEVLQEAKRGKYAIGLFNTINLEMIEAAIKAAEDERSPIIIGTAEVLLKYTSLSLLAPSLLAMAKSASVPVVVHFDHGISKAKILEALELGFTSVMFDGSMLPHAVNIQLTKEIVEIARKYRASVEAEIGHVGGDEDGGNDQETDISHYTTVEEAKIFVNATGIDALAVAIGSQHGVYKREPKLDFPRLKAIEQTVQTPLVLHGGSGISDTDFQHAINLGITKINIFTDLTIAAQRAIQTGIANGKGYLEIGRAHV